MGRASWEYMYLPEYPHALPASTILRQVVSCTQTWVCVRVWALVSGPQTGSHSYLFSTFSMLYIILYIARQCYLQILQIVPSHCLAVSLSHPPSRCLTCHLALWLSQSCPPAVLWSCHPTTLPPCHLTRCLAIWPPHISHSAACHLAVWPSCDLAIW